MSILGHDSFKARRTLNIDGKEYDYFSLEAAEDAGLGDVAQLPVSLKVLLENLLQHLIRLLVHTFLHMHPS